MSNVLQLEEVTRDFVQAGEVLHILQGVNLTLKAGEVAALVGPSGSGKTTLLQIAGLLDNPSTGKVTVAGKDCSRAGDARRTAMRLSSIGFVYQFHHLLPEFSAEENIMVPQMIAGVSPARARKRAKQLLEKLGLSHRAAHRPARLSGGEQQRVAIGRALANNPSLLLADEPTGNLDAHTAESVFSLLLQLAKEQGLAALIATHNLDLAKRMDRTIRMHEGKAE